MKEFFAILLIGLATLSCTLLNPRIEPGPSRVMTEATVAATEIPLRLPTEMPAQHIVAVEPSPTPLPGCKVTPIYLNIRACAGIHCAVVGFLKQGELVEILQSENGWFQITSTSVNDGWINSHYCEEE